MMRTTLGRSSLAAIATAGLLLAAVAVNVLAAEEHPVTGRWNIEAQPGGAVWAFQPSGALFVNGPGEIISEGTWSAAEGDGAFDAAVDVPVSGQTLSILGQVSPDGAAVALYVTATEPERPDDWIPWPAESRLQGQPFGMMAEDTPEPTEPPLDCLRPEWVDGAVDWDRCDEGLTAS